MGSGFFFGKSLMPIGAINVSLQDQLLCLRGCGPDRGATPYFSFRRQGVKVWVDDSPVVDESTDPWGVTKVNEIQVGSLTGNLSEQEKHDLMVGWGQRYLFDTIKLIAGLEVDDADRIADPDNDFMFWCDEDGTKNPSGLWVNSRAIILVDFNINDLANGILNATIRAI